MTQEQNYKVIERAENAIKKHGTIENAIKYLKAELESFHSLTNEFSYDCVYHGITCNNLIISYLEKHKQ